MKKKNFYKETLALSCQMSVLSKNERSVISLEIYAVTQFTF